jgi:tetratricopeptide repeat protein
MELVLERWPSRILAAAVAVAATAALSVELWKHVEAGRLAQEGSVKSLERALRLEPRNAELYWRLGRAQLFSEAGSPVAAIAALEEATALDPHTGAYWVDLSQARENSGDAVGASRALDDALAAEPRTPRMIWLSMSFALRNNQPERALDLGRELAAAAPPYTARVLSQLAEVEDLNTLIESFLPADQVAVDQVAAYLINEGDVKPARALWNRVLATGIPPSSFYLRRFLDLLIWRGDGELAARVWTDSIGRGWIGGDRAGMHEPLYNSDFRRPMLGFGFDWKVVPQEETSVWVSDEGPQPGQACLCADFSDRARAEFSNVSHPVVVEPGERYLLTARLRARHLATRSGAFLSVTGIDAAGQQPASTDHVVGSTAWEEVSAEFAAGPETHLAQVILMRPGVGADDAPASGRVCLAGVEWKRLNISAEDGRRAAPQRVAR